MNKDLFPLLVQMLDSQHYLNFIVKNAAYDTRCNDVAASHLMDMQSAIANCRRVLDEVLREQMKNA